MPAYVRNVVESVYRRRP